MRLGYEHWGNGATKLTLLHGMGGVGHIWKPIAFEFKDSYEIMAFDQRGHGKSSTQETDFHPAEFANDLKETLNSLKFHPSWIVGHSMGVRTACAFSHLCPEWTLGLILIDLGLNDPPGAGANEGFVEFLKKIPDSFESRVEMRNFLKNNAPDDSFVAFLMAVSEKDETKNTYHFPFQKDALVQTYYDAKGVNLTDWVKSFAETGKPVLLLRGGKSRVWTQESYEKDKANLSLFSNVFFKTIDEAGHGLPFEKRKEFSALVKDFISNQKI